MFVILIQNNKQLVTYKLKVKVAEEGKAYQNLFKKLGVGSDHKDFFI